MNLKPDSSRAGLGVVSSLSATWPRARLAGDSGKASTTGFWAMIARCRFSSRGT